MSSSLRGQNTCAHDHSTICSHVPCNLSFAIISRSWLIRMIVTPQLEASVFDMMVHKCLVHLFPQCLDAMLLQLFAFESTREVVLMDSAYICCHDAFPVRPLMCLSYCGSPKSSFFVTFQNFHCKIQAKCFNIGEQSREASNLFIDVVVQILTKL